MTKTINDEFMQQVATEQAWKNLSEDLQWTESLLEKYSDKVDWKEISSNKHITWTIPMLQKFSKKIDWKALSECVDEDWFTEVHMETFKDKWDWAELSGNRNLKLSYELLDKYIDRWNWGAIIEWRRWDSNNDIFSLDFLKRYQDRIPVDELENSVLWSDIIDEEAEAIKKEMLLKS